MITELVPNKLGRCAIISLRARLNNRHALFIFHDV